MAVWRMNGWQDAREDARRLVWRLLDGILDWDGSNRDRSR